MGRVGRSLFPAVLAALFSAWLFYRTWWGLIPGAGVGIYVFHVRMKRERKKQEMARLGDFRNMITALGGALTAGGSLSRALLETERDLGFLYGETAEVRRTLREILQKEKLGENLSSAFRAYGEKSGLPEIRDFAEMLELAERTGGNVIRIIRNTVEKLVTKIELTLEVERMVASKRLEQKIMTLMPASILGFFMLTAPDFTAVLYSGPAGRLIMTVALGMNILADLWGSHMVEVICT